MFKIFKFFFTLLLTFVFSSQVLAKKSDEAILEEDLAPQIRVNDLAADLSGLDEALKKTLPDSVLRESEFLRLAIVALQNRDDRTAIANLKKIPLDSSISDYASYYMSVALKNLGRLDDAVASLPATKGLIRRLDWDLLWQKADLLALSKKTAEVERLVANFLRPSKDKLAHIKAHYYLGKAYLKAGQHSQALRRFEVVLVQNPGSEFDERIFALCKSAGLSASQVLSEAQFNMRADRMIDTGYAYLAKDIYKSFMSRDPARYRERYAYAVFRNREYPQAAKLFESLLQSGRYNLSKPTLMTYLAQAYARHDHFEGAIRTNRDIMKSFPGTGVAAQAAGKLAFLYFDSGDYKQAIPLLQRAGPNANLRNNPKWFLFWSYVLTKDYNRALQILPTLKSRARDHGLMVGYWTARLHELSGRKSQAESGYRSVAAKGGLNYYGLLAEQRLSRGKLNSKTIVDENLLSHVPTGGQDWSGLSRSEFDNNVALERAALLYRAGLDLYSFAESQAAANGSSATRIKSLQAGGNFYFSYAVKDRAMSGGVSGCSRLCGFETAFPRAYSKYIEPFSRHWGLDPALAYAVMRQESVFKPEAMSWAFAYGLMQIIPPTGAEIAGRTGFEGYHVSLLNQPRINTLFGTFYLSHLGDVLGQEPIFQMAGYNAGPDAVGRWVKKYGRLEKDIFVELIAYEQTYDYVKKVLVNYLTYKKLY